MHPWNQPILDSLVKRLGRLPHAILLYGPQGVGKLALAERAAQLLLCEGTAKPCDKCNACRWYVAGNHPDFRRLEPEALAKEPADTDEEPKTRKALHFFSRQRELDATATDTG